MDITRDIVLDLLPLYVAGECSPDTKRLVAGYLQTHPDLKQQAQQIAANLLPATAPPRLKQDDELKSLQKTRRLLRLRSVLLAGAIFFSLVPFSFGNVNGISFFMLTDSPGSALIYGGIGLGFWIAWYLLRRKMSAL